nr:hypothetical protein [Halomarina sp. PSR21]
MTVEDDPEKAAFLREIAEEVRDGSSEASQLAAILYRVSDMYHPDGETTPQEIYLNVKYILGIKEQGGIERR